MIKQLNTFAAGLALAAAAVTAAAAPVTMSFTASDFDNLGGSNTFAGPIHGSITWEAPNPGNMADPIGPLLGINLSIAGHTFTLNEVGINGSTPGSTLVGGTARGIGALVGDGGADDFMLIFDRTQPNISFFGFTVRGQSNTLWAYPAHLSATYASNGVPEPSSLLLAGLGVFGFGLIGFKRRTAAA